MHLCYILHTVSILFGIGISYVLSYLNMISSSRLFSESKYGISKYYLEQYVKKPNSK